MASTSQLGSNHSSPESFDDDVNVMASSNWHTMQPPAPSAGSSATSSMPAKGSLPLQKRRRVTRACDECRRKKIKCDGKQPCTHCTVYSYECTYDQPSNRRRNPAPQYIEALENRLQRTETLLKAILPDVDVNRPDFDPTKLLPQIQAAATEQVAKAVNGNTNGSALRPCENPSEKESLLESMVEAAGRLDIDETGHMDFHGQSSTLSFLAQLNRQFGGILGEVKLGSPAFPAPKVTESPQSMSNSPMGENLPDTSVLPSREVATILVETCLDDACVLMRFIHRPTFMTMMDRIYELNPENYEEEDNSFIPLLYLALGVGSLFVPDVEKLGMTDVTEEANKYFNAGRRMIEMTDIRDIFSIQAVILMIIFLQSSARMSTCYSYVGIALSAAVRMGLHRALPQARFDPVEREVRRRIFWTIWKIDTYVSALLGLPKGISEEDIDQDLPLEIDDEFITHKAVLPQPENTLSLMAASNAHIRLMRIMAKVVKYIYPLKGIEASVTGKRFGYRVNQSKLHEIERDMGKLLDTLPMVLKPGADTPKKFLKPQYLLKMSYAHVQMMLYRPFVHYVSRPPKSNPKSIDEKPYAIAANCVTVARKIVHIADEMRGQGILNGAYWFTIYTTFFSVITLVYYVMVNPPDNTSFSILGDARAGKECLESVKDKSMAARRCTAALGPLFEKIPDKISKELDNVGASKKKRARASSPARSGDARDQSPSEETGSSGTRSPEGSMVSSLARRIGALPAGDNRRMSTPIHLSRNNFTRTPDPLNRRSSYEMYNVADFNPNEATSPTQSGFQAHLSGSGLPDLNAMLFPSPGGFEYSTQSPEPIQTSFNPQTSPQETPSPGFFVPGSSSAPFESLEGNLFGPLPPYLLQGQQNAVDGLGVNTSGNSSDGAEDANSIQGFFVPNGSDGMVPDFFRDEWDDVLMQQTFRGI